MPAPAALDYCNCIVVNFQQVPRYPFEINTGTRAAVYQISDTPSSDDVGFPPCLCTVPLFACKPFSYYAYVKEFAYCTVCAQNCTFVTAVSDV